MSSHSFAGGAARGIQTLVRLYPWSVLWVLFAVSVALIIEGSWTVIGVFVALVLIITYHSLHHERAARNRHRGQR